MKNFIARMLAQDVNAAIGKIEEARYLLGQVEHSSAGPHLKHCTSVDLLLVAEVQQLANLLDDEKGLLDDMRRRCRGGSK